MYFACVNFCALKNSGKNFVEMYYSWICSPHIQATHAYASQICEREIYKPSPLKWGNLKINLCCNKIKRYFLGIVLLFFFIFYFIVQSFTPVWWQAPISTTLLGFQRFWLYYCTEDALNIKHYFSLHSNFRFGQLCRMERVDSGLHTERAYIPVCVRLQHSYIYVTQL